MIRVNRLREYLAEKHAAIAAVNFSQLVLDDTELSNFLKDLKKEQNMMLFAVMPEFNMQGQEDNAKLNNKLMFMILEKTAYRDNDHDSYLDIFGRTQEAAYEFITMLLEDKENGDDLNCGLMSWLNENSINIYPIWKKNGCNGWGIDIDLLTQI